MTTGFGKNDGSSFDTESSAEIGDYLLAEVNGVVKKIPFSGIPNDAILSATGVSAATYGSSLGLPVVTVDQYGRITNVRTTAVGITSVNTLTNVSAGSPSNNDILIFVSGEWITTDDNLLSADVGDLAFLNTITSVGLLPDSGATSGTYGTATLIPQIEVDAKGVVKSVVEVTAAGGGGGATVSVLTDVLDVSASSLAAGNILEWDAVTSEWNPALRMTSAQTSSMIEAYGFITSASASTLSQSIVDAGNFLTSSDITEYVTSAELSVFDYITSASVSSFVASFNYLTSSDITEYITSAALSAFDYVTSASIDSTYVASSELGSLAFADVVSVSSQIADGAIQRDKLSQMPPKTVIGNITGVSATPTLVSVLDEDDMASNSDTALATQQSIKTYVDSQVSSGTGAFGNSLLHIQDQKAPLTNGGNFASGAWRTRDLNTVVTNEISGASLATNQITIPAGSYFIQAKAPANSVIYHQARLFNVTASVTLLNGTTEYNDWNSSDRNGAHSFVTGRFSVSVSSALELQHRCTNTDSAGFGLGNVDISASVNIYSEVCLWKI